MIHFSNEIIFGQLLYTFGDFYLVTLSAICRDVFFNEDQFVNMLYENHLVHVHCLECEIRNDEAVSLCPMDAIADYPT